MIVYSVVQIIPSKLLVAKCNDAECTGGDETISTIHPQSANVGNSSMKIGIDGFPVISFQAGASGLAAIKVAKCNDEACSGGDETISIVDDLPNSNGSPHFSSIGIGLDGNPLISYRKTTASIPALKVVKCNDPACAGGNERITTVDNEDQAGVFGTSIVIGGDGLPLVSHQRSGGGLKVVHCSVTDCDP